eukprot:6457390-Amphidinium_carterae.1
MEEGLLLVDWGRKWGGDPMSAAIQGNFKGKLMFKKHSIVQSSDNYDIDLAKHSFHAYLPTRASHGELAKRPHWLPRRINTTSHTA